MSKSLFLLHARHSYKDDLAWKIPEIIEKYTEKELEGLIPCYPPEISKVINNRCGQHIGWLGFLPLKGTQIISDDMAKQREFKTRALNKIFECIDTALDYCKGEHLVVGLGSLTAPITNQGSDIIKRYNGMPISVTTGNAYTAYITVNSILKLAQIRKVDVSSSTIAVLGATGSVGSAVSHFLAKNGSKMLLIARNLTRLENLKSLIVNSGCEEAKVKISTDIDELKEAQIVIVTTSSNSVLIRPEHCRENAIIYDDTQPRNSSEEILTKRPDVLVVDGGIVETPNIDYSGFYFGLPPQRAFACLSETLMLGMEDCRSNYTGNVTLEQMEEVSQIAVKYCNDFYLAHFSSFGKELDI